MTVHLTKRIHLLIRSGYKEYFKIGKGSEIYMRECSQKHRNNLFTRLCTTLSSESREINIPNKRLIAINNKERHKLVKKKPDQPFNPEILKVALIGAPNAGKSTLANKLIGQRFASVSSKVHTTRESAIGSLTEDNKQVILLDTPGIIHPGKRKQHNMERTLVIDPHSSLFKADLIAVIVDASTVWGRNQMDREVLKALFLHKHKQSILIINKVDLLDSKHQLLKATRILTEGTVAGKQESFKISDIQQDQEKDLEIMFDKMDLERERLQNEQTISNSVGAKTDPDGCQHTANEIDHFSHLTSPLNNVECKEEEDTNAINQKKLAVKKSERNSIFDSNFLPDLWNNQDWHEYHDKLRKATKYMYDKRGWPHFSAVFMVSALNGEGVVEIKDYLLRSTCPGDWLYSSQFITDQHPLEIAKMCIKEKLLNYLPNEIPYNLTVTATLWEENEDGLLCSAFAILCKTQRELKYVIGGHGETIRKIAREAKQDLMNTFRKEMTLKLIAKQKSDDLY